MKRQYLQPTTATNTYNVAYNCMIPPTGNAGEGGTGEPDELKEKFVSGRLYR